MNPIDELKQEHEGIKLSLDILSRIVERLGKDDERDGASDLERLIEFFTVFVDTCHHGKEEELLFPALEAVGVPREGGPVGVMLADHDVGRAHIRAMRSGLAEYRSGNRTVVSDIRKHADAYSRMLRMHIEKENQVLFHIAQSHLSEEVKNSLTSGFEQIESNRVGSGKHEMFHRMLEELQRKYCE